MSLLMLMLRMKLVLMQSCVDIDACIFVSILMIFKQGFLKEFESNLKVEIGKNLKPTFVLNKQAMSC